MTENISNLLINNDMNIKNVEEKVHIIMGLVDNYCHEVVYLPYGTNELYKEIGPERNETAI